MWGGSTTSALNSICAASDEKYDVVSMAITFASALLHRKRFRPFAKLIVDHGADFIVEEEIKEIYIMKKSSEITDKVVANVRKCLEVVRLNSAVVRIILDCKTKVFDVFSEEHMNILNSFWNNMKPTRQRSNPNGFISADWIELGFQNADPTTDFRSMGLLGLIQLHYFSENRTQRAKFIHAALSDPMKYYPFAIIGINITSFVFELIQEYRVQRLLLENLTHTVAGELSQYDVLPSNDPVCIQFGVNIVHDFYCLIFEEFYLQWVIMNPESIMSFNMIFDEVKQAIRSKYDAL
jgi:ELMO domain-containing protein